MIIQELLQSGVRSTLRAVYYNAANMFRTQRECDSIVDDIACFLSCRRENPNIVGADKGEVIGNLCYTMEGDKIECFKRYQVITHSKGLEGFQSEAKFILVIEKQATVFQLCEYHFSIAFHVYSLQQRGTRCDDQEVPEYLECGTQDSSTWFIRLRPIRLSYLF